jgi:hypothetical protein
LTFILLDLQRSSAGCYEKRKIKDTIPERLAIDGGIQKKYIGIRGNFVG